MISLFKASIEFTEFTPIHREYFENSTEPKIALFCCYLNRDTKFLTNNGIATYINFLNESISIGGKSSLTGPAKTIINSILTSNDQQYKANRENIIPKYSRKSCKEHECNNLALEARDYYGYCEACFSTQILKMEAADKSRKEEEERSKRLEQTEEIEALNRRIETERADNMKG